MQTCNDDSGGVVPCTDAILSRQLRLVSSYEERFDPDREGHLKIGVNFNQAIDPASVVVGKTVIIDAPLDHNASAKLIISVSGFEVVTDKKRAELFPPGPHDIDFVFTVKAAPGNTDFIKGVDGAPFMGRPDKPPGDYVVHYTCKGMDPFLCQ
jgi:hypothetical protein